jgi:uncharacterized protein
MPNLRPIALITGASSGIGAELARVFAAHDHEIVLVARNETQLTTLANEIGAAGYTRPHVVSLDLGRIDASARISHELASRGVEPAYVVNNAGFGLAGMADELDRGEQLAMIDLNVRVLTDLSLRWIDSMRRHGGGLLNVASVAGFLPGPGMAVYYASKAYVVSLTEALHAELVAKGVRVTALCPGPVETGFQERAGLVSSKPPPVLGKSAASVARQGYAGLMAGRRLVIPGVANVLVSMMPRLLPRSLVLRIIHSYQLKRRKVTTGWPRRRPAGT